MWASCPSGLNALSSAMLPPKSAPVAALTSICCACSFAMFSLSFSKSKNSASSYFVSCCILRKIEASLSGKAILSFGSKIVSLTNVSYVGLLCICDFINFVICCKCQFKF